VQNSVRLTIVLSGVSLQASPDAKRIARGLAVDPLDPDLGAPVGDLLPEQADADRQVEFSPGTVCRPQTRSSGYGKPKSDNRDANRLPRGGMVVS
jgi:hypothetical protein